MNKRILIVTLILIGSSFSIFGQVREITEGEFYSTLRVAEEKKLKFSRREKMKAILYSKGIVREIAETTDEFLIPNKQREVV